MVPMTLHALNNDVKYTPKLTYSVVLIRSHDVFLLLGCNRKYHNIYSKHKTTDSDFIRLGHTRRSDATKLRTKKQRCEEAKIEDVKNEEAKKRKTKMDSNKRTKK